jgi:hypothetical protein
MALTLRVFAEVVEERFDVGEVGGLCGEPEDRAQALGVASKEN